MNSDDRDREERLVITIVLGLFFAGLFPFLLARLAPRLDRRFGLPPLGGGDGRRSISAAFTISGFIFAVWTVAHQFVEGRGTPAPPRSPRKLLVDGPYRYCRNPMALGTFLFYLGVAVLFGTPVGVIVVIALTIILLIYIKQSEEPELVARFGADYEAYRARTPFFWPQLN